jgi:hypothetical protein
MNMGVLEGIHSDISLNYILQLYSDSSIFVVNIWSRISNCWFTIIVKFWLISHSGYEYFFHVGYLVFDCFESWRKEILLSTKLEATIYLNINGAKYTNMG